MMVYYDLFNEEKGGIRVGNLKCNVCQQVFQGDNAKSEIQEHLLACAVSELLFQQYLIRQNFYAYL